MPGGRSHGLLERTHEIATLDHAVGAARAGTGSLVVVEGPAGIGKSRLLAAARLADPDVPALSALGSELDRASNYLVAAHLFGPAAAGASGTDRDTLFDGQARLATPLFDGRPEADGDDVVRGLFWMAVNLTGAGSDRRAPLVLTVDDLQWADRGSLRFVVHLAARVAELPLALVVGVRNGPSPAADDLLDAVRGQPHAVILRPAPLTTAAVAALLDRELGEPGPAFVRACTDLTGGNPFLVGELVRALRTEGVAPADEAIGTVRALVPESVTRSVLARLAGVSEPARRLAVAVAVLGDRTPLPRAAALAELPEPRAERAADELSGAHVLEPGDPLAFTHPLVATAVHDTVTPFALARTHRRAARLLAGESAPVTAVAAHLLRTRSEGDPAAVATLRAAAADALRHGDPWTAVRLLQRARAEDPTGPQRFGVLLDLADAEAQAGDTAADRRVAEALEIATDTADVVRALTVRARICYAHSDHAGTAEASETALDLLDPDDPGAEPILAGYLAAGLFHAPSGVRTRSRMTAVTGAARAGRLPEHPALLAHLVFRAALDGEPADRVRALADRALATDPLGDAAGHGMALSLVVQALSAVDLLAEAEKAADRAVTAARRRGSVLAYALASYHRAIPRYHRGALADALADVEQGRAAVEEGWDAGQAWHAELFTLLHLERDELTEARQRVELGSPVSRDHLDHPVVLYARARLALADNRAEQALAHATEAGRILAEDYGMDHPGLFPWRPVAALATHRLGDTARAGKIAAEGLEQARELGVPRVIAQALRTLAGVGPADRALEPLAEAAELMERSPALLEQAAVLVDLGAAQRRRDEPGKALHTLRRAYAQAGSMQAIALARTARRQLHALGARPRRTALTGIDALTPTERRVADLAAAGLTNTQVAQALFVTPKTVETHLARAYRKLRISARRELAASLAGCTAPVRP
jgi:DNA-binding CsgD family transcriptional regulator